jgi:KipI family sensor histidine kinase inhibitor
MTARWSPAGAGRRSAFRVMRCGDSGLLLEFPDLVSVRRMYSALALNPPKGTVDLVPAATTLLVRFDPAVVDAAALEETLCATIPDHDMAASDELVHVPVRYDGVDLPEVARHLGMTEREIIAAHTERDWTVAFVGFAPGFAYLVGGDPRLTAPRRSESRIRVPAGSVGLAGTFSGVYPRASPGGWQLIGRTRLNLWDIERDPPALLVPGTRVRFVKEYP